MMVPISICEDLAKRNEIDPFLKQMVAGDEKWAKYENIVQKRSAMKQFKRWPNQFGITRPNIK